MINKIKFVYFDIGGVFLEWDKYFETAANKFKVKKESIADVFKENAEELTNGNMTPDELWKVVCMKLNISNGNNYDFLGSWIGDYVPIIPVHKLAREVAAKYKVGLISNIYKGMYPLLLKKGKIPQIEYSAKVLSCDVGLKKPDTEIYVLAQKMAQVPAENILFIDDSQVCIDTALTQSWSTLLFNTEDTSDSVQKIKELLSL